MSSTTTKSAYWAGARDGAPFILIMAPFAMLFGVIATEAGLNVIETMGMSVLIIAGAAQFTAIQLMLDEAPTVIVLITALAVNLRMAMYSASFAPILGKAPLWKRALIAYLLVDQTYALSSLRYETKPEESLSGKLAYLFGVVTPVVPVWYAFSYVGAVVGTQIPESYALDFAIPIAFLALTGPALRTLPHVLAALVSCVGALLLLWVPFNLGLIIAAFLAMMVGAYAELKLMPKAAS
ncbi:MAG: AzlC family ABC transporter permease [Pseudomonadota bacterium]